MDDFDKYLGEQLNDPEFKKEWDSSEMEYQLMMMVLKARNEQNLTQSELAERTGIRQSNISRIERGRHYPPSSRSARLPTDWARNCKSNLYSRKGTFWIAESSFFDGRKYTGF